MNIQQIMSIVSIVVGWISMALVCSYAIPQFIKIVKTKNTSSFALSTYIMFAICSSLMLSWNIGNVFKLNEDTKTALTTFQCVMTLLPSVTLNVVNVSLNISSLIIKLNHLHLCKKLKVDELKLASILLAKKITKHKKKGSK